MGSNASKSIRKTARQASQVALATISNLYEGGAADTPRPISRVTSMFINCTARSPQETIGQKEKDSKDEVSDEEPSESEDCCTPRSKRPKRGTVSMKEATEKVKEDVRNLFNTARESIKIGKVIIRIYIKLM